MNREVHIGEVLRAACHIQAEFEVVVVIHRTAHDLERFVHSLSGQDKHRNRCSKRVAIGINLQSVGIAGIDHAEFEVPEVRQTSLSLLAVVLQFDAQIGGLVRLDMSNLVGVGSYLGFSDGHGSIVEQCAWVVERSTRLALVRAERRSRLGDEHVGAV